jgi:hypothetical protein
MSFVELSGITVYAQPSWNRESTLVEVQAAVAAARSRIEAENAYNALLYAIGNNHAGTYFPVVLTLFPFFEQMLRQGLEWPRFTVIEALVDLCSSFWPELGHELFTESATDEPRSLRSLLLARVGALDALFESIASGHGADAESARQLLRALREEA